MTSPAVHVHEVLDSQGRIIGMHFFTPDGRIANAFGTPVRFQTLAEWEGYVSLLWSDAGIRDAWRLLLSQNQAHDFSACEKEQARQMLVERNRDLEMIYKEK